jgi:hypothetical protein
MDPYHGTAREATLVASAKGDAHAGAEFGFVSPDEVLAVSEREQASSFDAPGARYTHRDGLCTFEVLIAEHGLVAAGLDTLARIVHAADIENDLHTVPQAAGLKAIADGFVLSVESDIERQQYQWPLYDALLAWCAAQEEGRLQGRSGLYLDRATRS